MFRPPLPRLLAGLALLATAAAPLLAATQPPPRSPWEDASLGLFDEAYQAFARKHHPAREVQFGKAVTLLNLQPKTDSNLDEAVRLFTAVSAANPSDELGVSSRYFIARVAQVDRTAPDNAAALAIYRQLAALDSPFALAQHALAQVALLELYDPAATAGQVRADYAKLDASAARLTVPSAIRDFNLVMADAALRFDLGDNVALDHLLAADRAGLARSSTASDAWVRIAELARLTHHDAVAIDYYRKFLAAFPRDSRGFMVRQRLDTLLQKIPANQRPAAAATPEASR